jgi:hypothetical protein
VLILYPYHKGMNQLHIVALLFSSVQQSRVLLAVLGAEDKGITTFRKCVNCSHYDTTSHPARFEFIVTPI